MSKNPHFRSDITSLRGIAIILVILFHYDINYFSYGYLGVDIFFVISGFVITISVLAKNAKRQFNVYQFYKDRCLRLLPALFFMLAFIYILCAFLYPPESFKSVGQFLASASLQTTNLLLFLKSSNYFGLENSDNPFFHTWSLGLEWQFYTIFPFLFFTATRSTRGMILFVFLIIVSFSSLSIFTSHTSATFYLPFFRFWELSVGIVLGFLKVKFNNKYLLILGVSCIILSLYPMPSTFHLDINSLMAVIGASSIILSGPQSRGKVILENIALQHIGKISYSLYLWHIPIYVLLRSFFDGPLLLIITACLLYPISVVSFYTLENWKFNSNDTNVPFAAMGLVAFILVFFGFVGHLNGGFPERSNLFKQLVANNGFGLVCNGNSSNVEACSTDGKPQIAVLGNSYAMVFIDSLANAGAPLLQLTKDSCAIGYVDDVADINDSQSCSKFYTDSVRTINTTASIETVLLSSTFEKEMANDEFRNSFLKIIGDLEVDKIFVIGPPPRAPFDVGRCFLHNKFGFIDTSCNFNLLETHTELVAQVESTISEGGIGAVIDLNTYLCDSGTCVMNTKDGSPYYIDTGHLSKRGAAELFDKLQEHKTGLLRFDNLRD